MNATIERHDTPPGNRLRRPLIAALALILWPGLAGADTALMQCTDAREVLELTRTRHDPAGMWGSATLSVHIEEPRTPTPFRYSFLTLDNRSGAFHLVREYDGDRVERIVDTEGIATALLNGRPEISEADRERFGLSEGRTFSFREFYRMLYGLPMSLSDRVIERVGEARVSRFGEREVCLVPIELRDPVITRNWELMVDRHDHALVALRFDRPDNPELSGEIIVFDGAFTWSGITIPRYRHWYDEASGGYLGSDIIVVELER